MAMVALTWYQHAFVAVAACIAVVVWIVGRDA